jgi:dihydroorotase-like cyclic amidohydrolase
MRVTGKPVMTFVNGQMVWREGEFVVLDEGVGSEVVFN